MAPQFLNFFIKMFYQNVWTTSSHKILGHCYLLPLNAHMYTYLLEAVLLEIYKYFTNTTCGLIRDELKAGQYPHLSKLVRQYLCPPPSSLASERSFKVARDTLGDQRLRLLPENAEMNLFLKYNLRAIDHNNTTSTT